MREEEPHETSVYHHEELGEVEELEELEEIEELEDEDSKDGLLSTAEHATATRDACAHTSELESPSIRSILSTMEAQQFPSILIGRNLEIYWENEAYRRIFTLGERTLPVNLARDFAPDLDTDKSARIYHALGDPESGYNHREQLESKK